MDVITVSISDFSSKLRIKNLQSMFAALSLVDDLILIVFHNKRENTIIYTIYSLNKANGPRCVSRTTFISNP